MAIKNDIVKKRKMYKTENLLDLSHTQAKPYLEKIEYHIMINREKWIKIKLKT